MNPIFPNWLGFEARFDLVNRAMDEVMNQWTGMVQEWGYVSDLSRIRLTSWVTLSPGSSYQTMHLRSHLSLHFIITLPERQMKLENVSLATSSAFRIATYCEIKTHVDRFFVTTSKRALLLSFTLVLLAEKEWSEGATSPAFGIATYCEIKTPVDRFFAPFCDLFQWKGNKTTEQ